jgi:hypothetical protein
MFVYLPSLLTSDLLVYHIFVYLPSLLTSVPFTPLTPIRLFHCQHISQTFSSMLLSVFLHQWLTVSYFLFAFDPPVWVILFVLSWSGFLLYFQPVICHLSSACRWYHVLSIFCDSLSWYLLIPAPILSWPWTSVSVVTHHTFLCTNAHVPLLYFVVYASNFHVESISNLCRVQNLFLAVCHLAVSCHCAVCAILSVVQLRCVILIIQLCAGYICVVIISGSCGSCCTVRADI